MKSLVLAKSSLLSVSVSKSYVRIASKSLINFIASSFNIETTKDKGIPFEEYKDERGTDKTSRKQRCGDCYRKI